MLNNHRPKQPQRHDYAAKWSEMSRKDFNPHDMVSNLCSVFGIIDKPFATLIEEFVKNLGNSITNLKPYQVQDYYDSCKTRYSELYRLIASVCDYSQSYRMVLTRKDGKIFMGITSETEIHFQSDDPDIGDIVLDIRLTGHPKCYGLLSKALIRGIIAEAENGNDPINLLDTLLPYLQVILTVGQLYDDLRGGDYYINQFEHKMFEDLQSPEKPLTISKDMLQQVISDIDKGLNAPTYVRDLARAKLLFKPQPYTVDDYHISLRSTGTRVAGRGLNGLSASIIETDDEFNIDSVIGYHSYYRKTPFPNTEEYWRTTLTIEQHKLKRRGINTGKNPIQDRMNWYHRGGNKILHYIPSDCTFDQDAGRRFAKLRTKEAQKTGMNIYSCDISSATDNLSIEYQIDVLAIFFGSFLAEGWGTIMRLPSMFKFSNGDKKILQVHRGQPQGLKSSFPAFALAHHLLMRMVMKDQHLEDVRPEDFYRVLGDDSIISYYDPNRKILDSYERFASDIGWEINHSKGYYYFADQDTMAVAEFAKVRYCNGYALSPLPLMLCLHLSKDTGILPALMFRAQHLDIIYMKDVYELLTPHLSYTLGEIKYISLLSWLNLGNWSYFRVDNMHGVELSSQAESIILINYFKSQLYRTTLGLWLPSDYSKSELEGWDQAKRNSLIFMDWVDYVKESADLPIEHKFWQLMLKQERLVEAISSAINDASLSYAGLGLDITIEESSILISACELINQYEFADPDSIRDIIPKACKILSRFNPRSDAANSAGMASMIPGYSIECISELETKELLPSNWVDEFFEESIEEFITLDYESLIPDSPI